MPRNTLERRLAAVFSADAVGYSRLMAEDPEATVRTISAYRDQIRLLVAEHSGRVVDAPGDNLLAEFPAATAAAECAIEVQRILNVRNATLPDVRRMQFRIGLHLGEVLVDGAGIHGDGVNVAARLEGLAEPGGVVCSGAIRDQLLSANLSFQALGEQKLKNIPTPVPAYRISANSDAPSVRDDDGSPAIAVLPFDNMSGDPDQEYFADGITEDLITDLSGITGLFVTSRTSSFVYKGSQRRIEEIGRELGVRYLLEGSVRRSLERLRITAQLIDARNGRHLWAKRFDRERGEIFALQDEVTREIISALRVELRAALPARLVETPRVDLEAHDLCLRGTSYLRRFDRTGMEQARPLFLQATQRDPDSVAAWARLGDSYTMEHAFWARDGSALEHAIEFVGKATRMNPDDPEALLCFERALWFAGRLDECLRCARRAVELQPGSAEAHAGLARVLRSLGQFDESAEAADVAVRLNPLDPSVRAECGAIHYFRGLHEDALTDLRTATQLAPDFLPAYLTLAATLSALGREREAASAVAEIRRIAPGYCISFMNRHVPGADVDGILAAELRKAGLPE